LQAVGFQLPKKNILLSIGKLEDKVDVFSSVQILSSLGYLFYATEHTHDFLVARNISSVLLHHVSKPRTPNVRDYLEQKRVDLVINIPSGLSRSERTDGYYLRRLAVDYRIPLLTNVQLVRRLTEALHATNIKELPLLAWPNFLPAVPE
jgi:carbamoyl-phosphate synthase large subunit